MKPTIIATTDPQVVQRAGKSIMMAAAIEPEAFMLAEIVGTLSRSDNGCLSVSQSDDTDIIVQFSYGTLLADDGESIDVPNVGTVHLGDAIAGGGGYGQLDGATDLPDECRDATGVLFWQVGVVPSRNRHR